MAPYSMDPRERVVRAWDASGDAEEVAATFAVSRAWVHRLVQRRRETGSLAPRQQTKFRSRALAGQEARLAALIAARPDATLAELREALPTTAALSTLWLEIDRLGLTVKKTVRASEQARPNVVDCIWPDSWRPLTRTTRPRRCTGGIYDPSAISRVLSALQCLPSRPTSSGTRTAIGAY